MRLSYAATSWLIRKRQPSLAFSPTTRGARNVKDQLESLVGFMVERGILLDEAVTEFEKKFIRRVLEKLNGNQSRAAKVLGMHRNTLSRKIEAYKLDQVGRRRH
jgi:DNA-binding NtrC family response regulator